MKLIKFLDQKGTTLVSEPLNQTILKTLVTQERSVSDLSKELNQPTLKVWRKMQMLQRANLIEQTRTEKVGNIREKTLPRHRHKICPTIPGVQPLRKTPTSKKPLKSTQTSKRKSWQRSLRTTTCHRLPRRLRVVRKHAGVCTSLQ